jgi:hypothetical protein
MYANMVTAARQCGALCAQVMADDFPPPVETERLFPVAAVGNESNSWRKALRLSALA